MVKKIHYVNNKDFYEALVQYRDLRIENERTNLPPPRIPEYIGVCIYKIATKLATKGNFVNYSFREEMISDGIENCINYLNNFNPDKTKNPFAYFTRIIYNAYILRIQKEKKQTYIKYKAYENVALFGEFENETNKEVNSYDNINTFVKDYEQKLSDKKSAKKVSIIEELSED